MSSQSQKDHFQFNVDQLDEKKSYVYQKSKLKIKIHAFESYKQYLCSTSHLRHETCKVHKKILKFNGSSFVIMQLCKNQPNHYLKYRSEKQRFQSTKCFFERLIMCVYFCRSYSFKVYPFFKDVRSFNFRAQCTISIIFVLIIVVGQVNKFLENLSEFTRNVMSHYFLTNSIFQLITVKLRAEFIAWFHFCRRLKRTIFAFFANWNEFRAVIKFTYERFNAERNQSRVG